MEMEWESEFSEYTELEWEISIPFNTDVDPRVYVAVRWVPVTITWENGWSEKRICMDLESMKWNWYLVELMILYLI